MFCLLTLVVVAVHVTCGDAVGTTPDPVIHLTTVTNQLASTINQLNTNLTALKTDLTSKTHQINSLTSQLKVKDTQISNLTRTLAQKTKQLSDLDSYCKNHIGDLTKRVGVLETPIAFTARFANDTIHTIRVGHYQNLIFDRTNYQTGGTNYNHTTGVFIAPSAGTYAFFLTIQRNDPDQDDCLEANIMKNTNTWLAVATACPSGYSSASNMATALLRTGDRVYVRSRQSQHVFGFVHTTFSGFKLTAH